MSTKTRGPEVTVDLPERFYDDHVARDLPGGVRVRDLKGYRRVKLNRAEYDEMLSDARHYAHANGPRDFEGASGLVSSARGAVKRLEKVGRPPEPYVPTRDDYNGSVERWVKRAHEQYAKAIDGMAQRLATEPAYAIRWHAYDVISTDYEHGLARYAEHMVEAGAVEDPTGAFLMLVRREHGRLLDDSIANSSDSFHNAADLVVHAARRSFLTWTARTTMMADLDSILAQARAEHEAREAAAEEAKTEEGR
jgi:hypothetical protein